MSITTLTIDAVNISTVYGFWLARRRLSAPEVKAEYIDIPAANGEFDASEALGAVFYKNRDLSLDLIYPADAYEADLSDLTNYLHGKRRKIVFGSDSDWYHIGRISVGEYDSTSHRLAVSASVFPYKLAVAQTVVTKAVTTSETISLQNDAMPVVPVITVDAEMTLAWGQNSKTIAAGTYQIAGLELGSNETLVLTVTGTGNITITYRKGRL